MFLSLLDRNLQLRGRDKLCARLRVERKYLGGNVLVEEEVLLGRMKKKARVARVTREKRKKETQRERETDRE